jgi:hypothetical protein
MSKMIAPVAAFMLLGGLMTGSALAETVAFKAVLNSPMTKSLFDQSVSGAAVMTSIAALPSISVTTARASATWV